MIVEDRWGCPITVTAPDDVRAVEEVMDSYFRLRANLPKTMETEREGRRTAFGRIVEANLLLLSTKPDLWERARATHHELAPQRGELTRREQHHLEALGAWLVGDLATTLGCWEQALDAHPTDVMALRLSHFMAFNRGELEWLHEAVATRLDAWRGVPGASLLLGMQSFAAEELGRYERAEQLGREAVDVNAEDLWAIHAVAHVLEMQDRREEGVAWVDTHAEELRAGGSFARHVWWHQALYRSDLGHHDQVLDLYDTAVRPMATDEGLDLSNAISLLLREEMAGVDVGHRWLSIGPACRTRRGHHVHVFNDVHAVAGLARAGEPGEARAHLVSMRSWADERSDESADLLGDVGLAVGRAVLAHCEHRWAEVVEHLEPVNEQIWRIGGSHAQRDLFTRIFDHASSQK